MELDFRRVRFFLQVSRTLNFSQAARELGISQPALTKSVQKLEEAVGGRLIRREGRHTHLTQLGQSMLPYFKDLDVTARRAGKAAKDMVAGHMPVLRIGVMCTVSSGAVSEFISKYQGAHPQLEIILLDYVRSDIARALLDGIIDMAIVGAQVEDEQKLRYIKLYSEPLILACADDHPLAGRSLIGLEDVVRYPYLDRLRCEFRETFLNETRRRGFQPMFSARSDREDWIQSLIQKGAGISIVPEKWVYLSGIRKIKMSDPTLSRTVFAAIAFGREDTVEVQRFLNSVRSYSW
ncbi:MAG: DNA-binding transcriptional LysR family regulator [Paracoccaceae bacterium]|jgi:DNA-binding transcriptional LysR family regulator